MNVDCLCPHRAAPRWRALCTGALVMTMACSDPEQPPGEDLSWKDRYIDAGGLDASSDDMDASQEAMPDLQDALPDHMNMDASPDLDQGEEELDLAALKDMAPPDSKIYLYVSGGAGEGTGFVTRFEYERERGRVTRQGEKDVGVGRVLTYLAYSPRHRLLYAPDEFDLTLHLFDVSTMDGSLSTHGTHATRCHGVHVMLDPAQEHLVMPCYREGETELFHQPDRDGLTSVDLVSSGQRTHQACMSPDAERLFVVSLEEQKLVRYRIDGRTHQLEPLTPRAVAIPGNIGPRHMAMHPTHPVAYILGELQPSLHVAKWDETTQNLSTMRGVSLLEDNATRETTGAAIRVHPSGEWLLSTQRFADGRDGRLVILALDEEGQPEGEPRFFSTLGKRPRDMHISPDGSLIAVANRSSSAVALFGFDAQTGELTYLRSESLPSEPLSVLFITLNE